MGIGGENGSRGGLALGLFSVVRRVLVEAVGNKRWGRGL